ncbi:heterokaryon incompatibility protein-domain-containing protein [Triangularia setosa]|uniref:Heterokaryon incompatibility protein-domain-containing protein n=1 Tax=Triangularia setosa TaxID=2587417 RepID=A0AAN6VXA6_9PEZI|nr:heterokaryon incompatibility protein-domain-containing protein [Podospora setosa]
MNLLDSDDILQLNNKLSSFVLISANRVDDEDVDIFIVKPPGPATFPVAADPPLATHRGNINISSAACGDETPGRGQDAAQSTQAREHIDCMTRLCDTCHHSLNYFGYYLHVLKSQGKEAVESLPTACLLHTGANTLQDGEDGRCHLCVLLMANLRIKRLAMESIDQSNIEMCWQSDKPAPTRLHFALTHREHPRSAKNYWNILKLQIWPSSEFNKALFGMTDGGMERHPSTESTQARDNALQWLNRCQANEDGKHNQCNSASADWLPTRLLDVTSAIETSILKLVAPLDNPEAFVSERRYITLSHCWGKWGASQLPVLIMDNMSERLQDGVPMSLLPKTFADAVKVAHWFKVQWLWIDSLCILQDSQGDWQRESIMMYDVYKNALLNISADDSPDGRFGCFRDRDPLAVLPMNVQFPDEEGWKCWLTPDTHAVFESITQSPLAKRGWVFQERQLSRRVLHFTSHELIWECCAEAPYFASETFPGGPPFKSAFDGKPKFQTKTDFNAIEKSSLEVYKAWATICKEYSSKTFSHIHDKLVALSGLAQEFEAVLPEDTYLAGLWRSNLPQSLLWQSSGRSSPVQTTERYLAPSWSWLSIDGPVLPSYLNYSGSTHSLVNIVDVMTTPLFSSKPTASLKDASMTMQCFMRPVEIRPDYEKKPWYMLAMGGGKAHKLVIKDEDGTESFCVDNFPSDNFEFSFDIEWDENMESGPESVAGYFALLTMSTPTENDALCIRGLLVEPVSDDREATYKRMGLLSVYGPHCQRIKYKMLHNGGPDEGEQGWDRLLKRLRATHQSFEKLKGDKEEDSLDNGDVSSDAVVNDDEISTTTDEGLSRQLRGLHLAKMEDGFAKIGVQTADLGSLEAPERLYALDGAVDTELESSFERLAFRMITLI